MEALLVVVGLVTFARQKDAPIWYNGLILVTITLKRKDEGSQI